MNNMLIGAALLIAVFTLNGCTPMVGGPCEYQTSVALAQVQKSAGRFDLILRGVHFGRSDLPYPFEEAIKNQAQIAPAKAGDIWHVLVDEQIEGTCTPLNVSLFQQAATDAANYTVYFPANSSNPSPAERNMLAAFAEQHGGCRFQLQGHTAESGSREYNIGLGRRMADSVAHIMQSNGIAKNRLITVSFGEERPQTTTGDADARHALNRRVEIIAHCSEKN